MPSIDIKLFLSQHHFMHNPIHVMIIVLILDNFCITGDGHGNLEKLMRKLINNETLTYIYQIKIKFLSYIS